MYLNSYVPVYPVPTSFTTSLTLKRNIHLHETISVIEEQSKKKWKKEKIHIFTSEQNSLLRKFLLNEIQKYIGETWNRTPWERTYKKDEKVDR